MSLRRELEQEEREQKWLVDTTKRACGVLPFDWLNSKAVRRPVVALYAWEKRRADKY